MTGLKRGTVRLCPHDPGWAREAGKAIEVLRAVFGPAAVDIQHIGSTAIGGIEAKPILDIAVGVRGFGGLPLEGLEAAGFQKRHNRFSSNLLYLLETEERVRTHQVHILLYDSLQWHNYVDFRDYMNAFPEKAAAYEALKQGLAATCGDVQTVYTDGKRDYMEEVLAEARAYARNGGNRTNQNGKDDSK